jgi:shikimate dehydrogenase
MKPAHPKNPGDARKKTDLKRLRSAIDEIDESILHLINRRLTIASEIGKLKEESGVGVKDPARETALINRLVTLNKGPLAGKDIGNIFGDVMAASRAIQNPDGLRPIDFEVESIYVVLGDPVAHSLGPVMHNRAFSFVGHRGVYVALRVTDIGGAMTGIRHLGVRGASVTIPHKMAVMEHLDEIDAMAERIGAVNTVINRDGKLAGYNSDWLGAVTALRDKTGLKGKQVAILGAGGAARAVGFGIVSEGGNVTLFNRSNARGEALAREIGADFYPLDRFGEIGADILINTTPVGMVPRIDEMPVRAKDLDPEMVVMDIVYNPLRTRLLREAEMIGCTIVNGVHMFVCQGAFQFELWTGKKAPVAVMENAVLEALDSSTSE